MQNEVVRDEPRISVNKLGEYLVASPLRRQAIIKEQKRPRTFQVNWYEFASKAITTFVLSGCNNDESLYHEVDRLGALIPGSEYEEQRIQTNIEAIDCFLEIYDSLNLEDMEVNRVSQRPPKMMISNVEISIWPEIVVRSSDRNGETRSGILKLYFSKTNPLDDRSGQYIATLLYQYAREYLEEPGKADYRLAQVIDVFTGKRYTAPRSYKRRLANIEAACQEICVLWSTV